MSDVLAFVFIACLALTVLKNIGYRGVGVTLALILVCIIGVLSSKIGQIGEEITGLLENAKALECAKTLFKVLGITYLSSICSETCEALGEVQLSKTAEVWGRVEIILLLIPYFKELLLLGGEFL